MLELTKDLPGPPSALSGRRAPGRRYHGQMGLSVRTWSGFMALWVSSVRFRSVLRGEPPVRMLMTMVVVSAPDAVVVEV